MWGGASSVQLIDMVSAAGFERAKFRFNTDADTVRPEVAVHADEAGYLLGQYDGYGSVHDPATAGTDMSWSTAQFDRRAFEEGAIIEADGSAVPGFLGRGRTLSPLFARPYLEQRVSAAFDRMPYTYYFLDGNAFGDFHDDWAPGRIVSERDDAAELLDQVRWVAQTFRVPVGSEGGSYLFTPVLSVVEGLIHPPIGFGDPDLRDPESEYFLGGYWPPEEPAIFFARVPMKDRYFHLHIDPRFKLPLYQAVFHDSVIAIPRDGGTRKFTNASGVMELYTLLHQTPPLYHLNLISGPAILEEALPLAAIFRETHAYSIDYPLSEFEYLSADGMVQHSRFGELQVFANFGESSVEVDGRSLPGMSARLRLGDREWNYAAR